MQLTEKDRKEIVEITNTEIARFIENLPTKVDQILTGAILPVLGLEKDYHYQTYKINHCNGNRSVITQIVENRCKEAINDQIKPVVDIALKLIQTDAAMLKGIAEECADVYHRALMAAVNSGIVAAAKKRAADMIAGLELAEKIDFKDILPTNTDLDDPKSFKTGLGQLILEELAKSVADGSPKKLVKMGSTLALE